MIDSLQQLFLKNLESLRTEIKAYSDEDLIWVTEQQVNNSAGTLCLHLCGNLQHFIGGVLGGSGYIRDRKSEFGSRCSRAKLMASIDKTKQAVQAGLMKLSNEDLDKTYPIEVFNHPMKTEYFLIHLQGHLTYHLGQISYHRRLLDIQS